MKKFMWIFAFAFALTALTVFFTSCSSGGDDGPDTMTIKTYDDLVAFAERVNGGEIDLNAELQADIEIPDNVYWKPIGCVKMKSDVPVYDESFKSFNWDGIDWDNGRWYNGTFNGNGYTIRGKIKADPDADGNVFAGFFADLTGDSKVYNLKLYVTIEVGGDLMRLGGVAGHLDGGTIENCDVTAIFTSNGGPEVNILGGIAGFVDDHDGSALIKKCNVSLSDSPQQGILNHPSTIIGCIAGVCCSSGVQILDCSNEGKKLSDYTGGEEYDGDAIGSVYQKE